MFLNHIGKPPIYLPFEWPFGSHLCSNRSYSRLYRGFFDTPCSSFRNGAKRGELGLRTAAISCGSLLSNTFGSLIASGILDVMKGILGHSAWRWYATVVFTKNYASNLDRLFYIESTLTIFTALITAFVLPGFPSGPRRWLSPIEVRSSVNRTGPLSTYRVFQVQASVD
jgi:hypothetical protein